MNQAKATKASCSRRKRIQRSPILRRLTCGGRWRYAEGAAMLLERERNRVTDDDARPSIVAWALRDTARRFPNRGATREARMVGRLLRAAVRMLGE